MGLDHDPVAAGINRALLLGERSALTNDLRRAFVESGTIHIFAISGMHVMIIAGVFLFLAAITFVPWRCQGAITLPLLWGYVYIIGAPPSAVRAALMASFMMSATLFGRQRDSVRAWCFAFLIMHGGRPSLIADVGSQLSFLVVLVILLAHRYRLWILPMAWLASLPLGACVFGRITPGGMLANVLIAGAATYSVVTSTISLLFGYVSVSLGETLNNFSALVTRWMCMMARVVAEIPGSNWEIGKWSVAQCLEGYVALGLFFVWRHLVEERRNVL